MKKHIHSASLSLIAIIIGVIYNIPYYMIAIFCLFMFWRTFVRYIVMPIALLIITIVSLVLIWIKYQYDSYVWRKRANRLVDKINNTLDD